MTTTPLGIDISKLEFDVCLTSEGGKLRHKVLPGTSAAYPQLSARLSEHRVERARLSRATTSKADATLVAQFFSDRCPPS